MIVAAKYSFNGGQEQLNHKFGDTLSEIEKIITTIDADSCLVKKSKEKTTYGKTLYSPSLLNKAFKEKFYKSNWQTHRELCNYSKDYYINSYSPKSSNGRAFREMDFVKGKVGVEVQFGKYAFMVYNVCAKMTIFKNFEVIDVGVEIVPVKEMADSMSSGISYFEQFVWDLEKRGTSDIDTPVLVIGVFP